MVVSKTCPGNKDEWSQDEDVLDTWFSSALWPFATLGWPKETEDFKHYFPTSCLVTGYDIIFFWVSRMIFQSLHFTNNIPFKDVVIHGLVRDSLGRKMSKSLGNGVDPVAVIDKYGTDSLRYFLATTAAPGLDMRYSEEKVQAANAYLNKIWNSARFALMNLPSDYKFEEISFDSLNEIDKFIISRLNETISKVTNAMEKYEFGIACQILHSFVYDDFCDFYLEMCKVTLQNESFDKESTYYALFKSLKSIILTIYPFAPFISEEIYLSLSEHKDSIMLESYPTFDKNIVFDESNVLFIKNVIEKIRAYKVDNSLAPNQKISLKLKTNKNISTLLSYIERFTFASNIELINDERHDLTSIVINDGIIYIDDNISKEEKINKLNLQLENINKEIKRSEALLNNEKFLAKAKKEKVDEEKEKYQKYKEQKEILEEKIKNI